jgi:hypothetical protein
MFEGANWESYVKTAPNCPPEQARRIALLDPTISFFFHCREPMVLTNPAWPAPRRFNPGDSVFFNGEPRWGSAPQCDGYVKDGMSVAYVGHVSAGDLAAPGCYVDSDGAAAVDVVCIFAANLCASVPDGAVRLAPLVNVPAGGTYATAGANLAAALQSGVIPQLQAKGITVLLTFLNNHDAAGWSEFDSAALAANFVEQLRVVVNAYGLDGIDIDDEYSSGTPIQDSLAMVTSLMQQALPGKIISKALWQDEQYFNVPYQGVSLQDTLTYGWEMSYGRPPQHRLQQYVELGMGKEALVLGFWSGSPSPTPDADVAWLKSNGYAGVMVYAFQDDPNPSLIGGLVDDWSGPGNWNKLPDCPA